MFQSKQSKNGSNLENIISVYLSDNGIKHCRQVPINREGFITVKKDSISLIDFVIGENVPVGTHIREYIVISAKKSCRERWLQDEWTFTNQPRKYILFTLSNDYPEPISKFREGERRKIITQKAKNVDKRKYKLEPNDLLQELL